MRWADGGGRAGARVRRRRQSAGRGAPGVPRVAQGRLPQGQGALPGGGGVVGDCDDLLGTGPNEAGGRQSGLGRRRRGAQYDGPGALGAQAAHKTQEAAQHEGHMRPQDPPVNVTLKLLRKIGVLGLVRQRQFRQRLAR